MLVVDPWHWLNQDGSLPFDQPQLFKKALRVAQVIEYGGTLAPSERRETLLQCAKRPNKQQCQGLLWVLKTQKDEIVAFCVLCQHNEMMVRNWQETEWADGMMAPVTDKPEVDPSLH